MVDIARVRKKARKRQEKPSRPRETAPDTQAQTAESPQDTAPEPSPPSPPPPESPPTAPRTDTPPSEPPVPRHAPQTVPVQPLTPAQIIARLLVRPRPTVMPTQEMTVPEHRVGSTCLVFRMGNEWYAIALERVMELTRVREHFTSIPNAPDEVLGVMNLRGHMIVVYHTYRRLGLPEPERFDHCRIAVVQDMDTPVGLLIEKQASVMVLPLDRLQSPPTHIPKPRAELLQGVVPEPDRVIGVLDLDKFLSLEA